MELDWELNITKCDDETYLVQYLKTLNDGGIKVERLTFQDLTQAFYFLATHFDEHGILVQRGRAKL